MNFQPPSVLEVLTGNKKILMGAVSLILALTLAFTSVYKKTANYSRKGIIKPTEIVGIERRKSNNEGELAIKLDRGTASESIEVELLDDDLRPIRSVSFTESEDKTAEIDKEVSYFRLVSSERNFEYEYRIKFSYQPFRLLSIPAGLFTIFGVIAVYKGFDQFISDFAKKKIEQSENEEIDEEGQHVNFMGMKNHNNGDT